MKYRIKITDYHDYIKGEYIKIEWEKQLEVVGLKVNEEEVTWSYNKLNFHMEMTTYEDTRKVDTVIITCMEDLLKIQNIMKSPLIISYDEEFSIPYELEIYNGYRE